MVKTGIRELDTVKLLAEVKDDVGAKLSAGTEGTVVAVYAAGEAFEVEFWNGIDEFGYSLATVTADDLDLA